MKSIAGQECKQYVPILLLVWALLLIPVERVLLPVLTNGFAGPWLGRGLAEILLLIPAVWMLPWRHKRVGQKRDVVPLLLAAAPAGAGLYAAVQAMLPVNVWTMTEIPVTAAQWAAAVLGWVILPAVCEEAFFRGCLTVHLMDTVKAVWACLLSTVVFAIAHDSVYALPGHLLISLLCTMLMMATGRIWAPMVAHMGYNCAALLVSLMPDAFPVVWLGIIPLAVMVHLAYHVRWMHGENRMTVAEIILISLSVAAFAVRYFV